MKLKSKPKVAGIALAAVLALAAAWPCKAATWTVTSTADDGSPGTLRNALLNAADGDTIDITATGTIYLSTNVFGPGGPLLVNTSVTITGPGPDQLAINGNNVMPVFWVNFTWAGPLSNVTVALSGLTIANGHYAGPGGALWNFGTLTLSNCTLTGNSSEYFGGAILNCGTLALTDSTLTRNSAAEGGGAILNGAPDEPGYDATLTLLRCTLSSNLVTVGSYLPGGGAIANWAYAANAAVTIMDSTLDQNMADIGGAVLNASLGDNRTSNAIPGHATVNIVRSTLRDNAAASSSDLAMGGALAQITGENPATYATLIVDSSTLSSNSVVSGGSAMGGAIMSYCWSFGTVLVRNSTLANNTAAFSAGATNNMGAAGGGIVAAGGALVVDNSTLSGNADSGGGSYPIRASGILVAMGANATIKNTLLANDPSAPNLLVLPADSNTPASTLTSAGFNLSTDDGGGCLTATGDLTNTDPLLGPLAANGGPTWTCALGAGSPAIDAAATTDSFGNAVLTDQRGVARPQGSANDIGAFEAPGGLAPRPLLVQIRDELVSTVLPALTAPGKAKLQDAINHLNKALEDGRWVDDAHLKPGAKGESVFNETKSAVVKLKELRKADTSGGPASLFQSYIDRLLAVDRLLANMALDEAKARGGNAAKLNAAEAELAKGDAEAGLDHPDKAIDHYKNSWKNAIAA